MPRNKARETINKLWEEVVAETRISISQDPSRMKQVSDDELLRFNIRRVPLDIEDDDANCPPLLLNPLELSRLRQHSPAPEFLDSVDFHDSPSLTPEFVSEHAWDTDARARDCYGLIITWAIYGARKNLPSDHLTLSSLRGLRKIW